MLYATFLSLSLSLSLSLLLIGVQCEKNIDPLSVHAYDSSYNDISPGTADGLGQKLQNPYSVESMLRARDSLDARGILAKSSFKESDFKPNYYYIRFKPKNREQEILLKEDKKLVLWDYPLDYKIPEGLFTYRDRSIPHGKPCYQYTAVRVDQSLPNVEYEILEKLILLSEPTAAGLPKSDLFVEYYTMLEQEALRITGNSSKNPASLGKAASWVPSGSVKVTDDVLGATVPIRGVNVRVRNWFRWWDGYTDNNGNFRSSVSFTGSDVSYSLRWQDQDNQFDIRPSELGQAFYNGPSLSTAWHLVISSGMSWRYAHVFRAAHFYAREQPFGLTPGFRYVSICVVDQEGRSSQRPIPYFLSDIKIMSKSLTARQLMEDTFHELAHEHHLKIEGNLAACHEKIAEGWAIGVEQVMTDFVYENRELYKLYNDRTFTKMRSSKGGRYTPVVVDLIDTYNQRWVRDDLPGLHDDLPLDNVGGYTLKQIQESLKRVTSFSEWRKNLENFDNPSRRFLEEYFSQIIHLQPIPLPAYTKIPFGQLPKGKLYYSPNGKYYVVFQADGNLVLYDVALQKAGRKADIWSSRTWNNPNSTCWFQLDGNLVIYVSSRAIWGTNTWFIPRRTADLRVWDNGQFTITWGFPNYGDVWSTTNDISTKY